MLGSEMALRETVLDGLGTADETPRGQVSGEHAGWAIPLDGTTHRVELDRHRDCSPPPSTFTCDGNRWAVGSVFPIGTHRATVTMRRVVPCPRVMRQLRRRRLREDPLAAALDALRRIAGDEPTFPVLRVVFTLAIDGATVGAIAFTGRWCALDGSGAREVTWRRVDPGAPLAEW